jgi:hypothetical protein
MIVVCDTTTGELVWTNVDEVDGDTTVVTSTGVTIDVPAGESVTTPYIGPGTWTATWGDGTVVEGEIPPACVDTTTTAATTTPPTTAPPTTAPPTSEAGSNTVVPPTSAASSGRLPSTGASGAAIAIGFLLIAAGIFATVIARRRATTQGV